MTPVPLDPADHSRVIEMAWSDEVPFEAIERLYGLSEPAVIALMKRSLKPGSYRVWRERVKGRARKHGQRHLLPSATASRPRHLASWLNDPPS